MKQKLIPILLGIALLALGLGQALGLLLSPLPENTQPAEDSATVLTGTVLRQEIPVYAPHPDFWVPVVDAGRVTAGQTLMITAAARDALHKQGLAARVEELRQVALPLRREMLHEALREGDGTEFMALVLSEGDSAMAPSGPLSMETVRAAEGGFFIPVADGLEGVLSPENPQVSLPLAPVEETAVGRLITSEGWYFFGQTELPLSPGDRVEAELLSGVFRRQTLEVEWREGEKVLFFCEKGAESLGNLRFLSVKILWEPEIWGGNFPE